MAPARRLIARALRQARSVAKNIRRSAYRRSAERQLRRVARDVRSQCWCGGMLRQVDWHRSYGVCDRCGCYVNRVPPKAEEFSKIYSIDCYWGAVSKMRGWPVLHERGDLYRRDGRLAHWLALVEKYAPPPRAVIEIGCAPGVLLTELKARGYRCVGVEPEQRVAEWIRSLGLDVRVGMFPDHTLALPPCDLLLAFDVLEHVPSPDAFLAETAKLLRPGGIAIIQTPIDQYSHTPPFGNEAPLVFDDVEHLFIFRNSALQELGTRAGLEVVSLSEKPWIMRHELCVYRKVGNT